MTAMNLHRYPSPSGGVALGKIGARRTASVLPYDAEVEYLQSMGIQWIDTGFIPQSLNFVWTTRCKFTADNGGLNGVTVSPSFSGKSRVGWGRNNFGVYPFYFGLGASNYNLNYQDKNWHTWKIDAVNQTGYIDAQSHSIPSNGWDPQVTSIKIFTSWRAVAEDAYLPAQECVSSSVLEINGVAVFDLIPVRFTNEQGQTEGAFFDRANPTVGMNPDGSARTDGLYRNRGTGAFLYGNDI